VSGEYEVLECRIDESGKDRLFALEIDIDPGLGETHQLRELPCRNAFDPFLQKKRLGGSQDLIASLEAQAPRFLVLEGDGEGLVNRF
jgi:hypothetical protein